MEFLRKQSTIANLSDGLLHLSITLCVCVSVCVCVRERERERECVYVGGCQCVCVCVCVLCAHAHTCHFQSSFFPIQTYGFENVDYLFPFSHVLAGYYPILMTIDNVHDVCLW